MTTETNGSEQDYIDYLARVRARFSENTNNNTQLFTTDTSNLYDEFVAGLPVELRQFYNCRACRNFVNAYGGLVVILENGHTFSPLWFLEDTPQRYHEAISNVLARIVQARVTGVFYSNKPVWGIPVTGVWHHFSVASPRLFERMRHTPEQTMAEKREDYGTLCRALGEYSVDTLGRAVNLLESESLYRSERVLGVAQWLLDLEVRRSLAGKKTRDAITWHAVASAPVGYCHPKSSIIGTLLDDIAAGLPIADVQRRFAAKMNPTQYQRSQSAPSLGAIAQADKLFAELGLAPALERRYARLDELPSRGLIWWPPQVYTGKTQRLQGNSLFGHLRTSGAVQPIATTPEVTITWEKFKRTVLPIMEKLEVQVPQSTDRFMALVTAANNDAPPILQWDWDTEANKNPFSWYYASGIDAEIRRRLVRSGGQFENVDVRCSLLWNNENDLDLHVVTPNGDHIYYANKRACRYGGFLDVDMNVEGETREPVENVRWQRGQAPQGQYQVFVNLYRTHRRNSLATPFSVEIEVNGQVYSHSGITSAENSQNHRAWMVRVAEFEYWAGHNVVGLNALARPANQQINAWGLATSAFVPVTAIVSSPNLWNVPPLEQHGQHAFFLLEGCKDSQAGIGRGFFTEMLKSELRPVRSVLEAYAAQATIAGADEATACGIGISSAATGNLTVRATTQIGQAVYTIDRWD